MIYRKLFPNYPCKAYIALAYLEDSKSGEYRQLRLISLRFVKAFELPELMLSNSPIHRVLLLNPFL
jgi:hypothetical protein